MFGSTFFHGTIKKLVTAFGTIFNDITIVRTNSAGNEVERIKVPLAYGPRDKFLQRAVVDDINPPVAITLPRMSFEVLDVSYDGSRKLTKLLKQSKAVSPETVKRQYVGVPWNVTFELNILTKTIEEGHQVVEQILPYFAPEWTVTVNLIPELDIKDDVPIVLTSAKKNDTYEGGFDTRQTWIWTLTFTAKAMFYGYIKEQGIIKKAIVDISVASGSGPVTAEDMAATGRSIRITEEPDPLDAEKGDDFGYTETIEEFTDGKKRNVTTGLDEDID